MIKKTTKRVVATYRPATWISSGPSLQSLMKTAWKSKVDLNDRIQGLGGDLSVLSSKLINYRGVSCVQLRIVEKGRHQLAVSLKDGIDDLSEITVPPPEGADEFLGESSFHAAIRENHVAFCASSLLSPNRFREYVTWIIRETFGDSAPDGGVFGLSDVPSPEVTRMLSSKPITKVRLGGPIGAKEEVKIPRDGKKSDLKRTIRRIAPGGSSWPKKLLDFVRAEGIAEDIPELDDIDQSRLTVSLEIGFERVVIDSDQAILKDLAALDVVDGDGQKAVEVVLKGGTVIGPDELIVRDTFPMEAFNGNVPRETYFQNLSAWLKILSEKGSLTS